MIKATRQGLEIEQNKRNLKKVNKKRSIFKTLVDSCFYSYSPNFHNILLVSNGFIIIIHFSSDCKNRQKIPFVKRLHADTAKLGTTFPPRGGHYPFMNGVEVKPFGRRSTSHSEPDLSPMAAYSGESETLPVAVFSIKATL